MPRLSDLRAQLADAKAALEGGVAWQMEQKEALLRVLGAQLAACQPKRRLDAERQRLAQAKAQLREAMGRRMAQCDLLLIQRMRELELLSPYRVLARGYAIVRLAGAPVKSAARLCAGDRVEIRFADGQAQARIEQTMQAQEG